MTLCVETREYRHRTHARTHAVLHTHTRIHTQHMCIVLSSPELFTDAEADSEEEDEPAPPPVKKAKSADEGAGACCPFTSNFCTLYPLFPVPAVFSVVLQFQRI